MIVRRRRDGIRSCSNTPTGYKVAGMAWNLAHRKAGIFAALLLALLIGAGPLCACLSEAKALSAPTDVPTGETLPGHGAHHHGGLHGGAHGGPAVSQIPDCFATCAHCASDDMAVDIADAATVPDRWYVSGAQPIAVLKPTVPDRSARPSLFAAADFAGGWRDPPPQTPITLKTRLLN